MESGGFGAATGRDPGARPASVPGKATQSRTFPRLLHTEMNRRLFSVFLFCLLTLPATARQVPRMGVVWDPPSDLLEAEADLRAIRAMGFTAVRTHLLDRIEILVLADTLGIDVYQEFELHFLTAEEMTDTLGAVRGRLADALVSTEEHRSARHFGFGFAPSTSDEAVCSILEELAGWARQRAAPGVQFYYVSWLPRADRCSESVDLVLLDDPIHDRPLHLLDAWSGSGPVGLAATGRRVDPEAGRGLLIESSEERQALFFEETIPRIRARNDLAVVFLYRWQDPPANDLSAFQPAPFGVVYGLQDDTGRARLARDVAEGILARGQTTFRLLAGTAPRAGASWFVLLGWLVLATIAVMVAASPRFRAMIPRYFFAHGFYRHAIQEGRDVLTVLSTVMLILLGLVIGLLGAQVTRMLTDSAPLHAFWYRTGVDGRAAMNALLTDDALLVIFIGSAGLLALVFWVFVWTLAGRRRAPLKPSQALATAVWPRWPMMLLLVAAMVVDGLGADAFRRSIEWMPAAWLAVALWGTIRTNIDLAQIARANPVATVVLWLVSPVVLLLAGAVTFMLVKPELAALLWSLWSP